VATGGTEARGARRDTRRRSAWGRAVTALAAATVAVLAATMAVAGPGTPPASAANGQGVGKSLQIRIAGIHPTEEDTWVSIDPTTDGSGYVRLKGYDGRCLLGNRDYLNGGGFEWGGCGDITASGFSFLPVSTTPAEDADAAEDRWFRLVTYEGFCVYTYGGKLEDSSRVYRDGAYFPFTYVDWCGASQHFPATTRTTEVTGSLQSFRVVNDERLSDGTWREWSNILGIARTYAAAKCVASPETSCSVRTPNSEGAFYPAYDPLVLRSGRIESVSLGCGVPGASGVTRFFNGTTSPMSRSVSSTATSTHTTQTSVGWKTAIEVSASMGVKDVWTAGSKVTTEVSGQDVETQTETTTLQETLTATIQPGEYYMYTWNQSSYVLTGEWRYGREFPYLEPWTMGESSLYPARINGQSVLQGSGITSTTQKDCDARPASVNRAAPTLAADSATCGTPEQAKPAPAVAVAAHACPGTWDVPLDVAGNADPHYAYQWYYQKAGGTPQDVTGQTASSFTLTDMSFDYDYLGVKVQEIDGTGRLSSAWVPTVDPLRLTPRATGPGGGEQASAPTALVGELPQGTVGTPYRGSALAALVPGGDPYLAPGEVLSVTDGALPAGIVLDPETGALGGTPTASGRYAFTLSAAPRSTGVASVSRSFTVTVFGTATVFGATSGFAATVGDAVSLALVDAVGSDAELGIVQGALPDGLSLDPATGVVSGVVGQAGEWRFTVRDAAPPADSRAFVLRVAAAADPVTPPVDPSDPSTPSIPRPAGEPATPSDAALVAGAEGGIRAGATTFAPGQTVTIDVGAEHAGEWVGAWLFSTPTRLGGWHQVDGAGRITVTIPAGVPAGTHRLAVFDATGAIIGWQTVTVTGAAAATALAATGASTAPATTAATLAAAALLLAVGVVLTAVRRPRIRKARRS
jgi:hypothetical protein